MVGDRRTPGEATTDDEDATERQRLARRRDELRAGVGDLAELEEEVRLLEETARLYALQLDRLGKLNETVWRYELELRELVHPDELAQATDSIERESREPDPRAAEPGGSETRSEARATVPQADLPPDAADVAAPDGAAGETADDGPGTALTQTVYLAPLPPKAAEDAQRRYQSLTAELTNRVRQLDQLLEELPTLRYKARERDALVEELPELRYKAGRHDALLEELKLLRKRAGELERLLAQSRGSPA